MITFTDIKKAVNMVLDTRYADVVPVIAQDITKGFARPSFTTEINDAKVEILESQVETSCTVTVYYFSDLKNIKKSIAVLDMQWQLPLLFGDTLHVADRLLNIVEPSANVVDGILVFEFDLLFYQIRENESEEAEFMQELHMNLKGK